ncbi:glycoside hydrolase family 76 protein [Pseudarthrobacter sp. NamE5]|uniref:glycoside hydrolase family 76 protein n=1 Tax=Pseudarthrobacter sp. NamE5 TaxID=2576839 RepID=UPI00110A934E|nr:glycoside hydrolase family 76 protein [Pseudarthrobacter sp. NamE5]TLM87162.1 glycosyl hydrolase [Pseudarthrobacter sp. NamE5]
MTRPDPAAPVPEPSTAQVSSPASNQFPSPATAPVPGRDYWQDRANEAARSVTTLFGRRLLFLPATHVGAVLWPSPSWYRDLKGALLGPWHYWWQAHYVDCLVDAGRRELGNGGTPAARFNGPDNPSAGRLASRLVSGIRLRNGFTFVNNYYDDMAWLALAAHRLDRLAEEAGKPGRRRNAGLRKSLTLQFDAASTSDMGGGVFWSRKRDFKNTPATAPVALYYARTGQPGKGQALLDWLDATLFDPAQGLYLDGARLNSAGELVVERAVYTYNQGPVLGALLELGGDANLARTAEVVDAVDRILTTPARTGGASDGGRVLRCEGTGDGGLFTGILCRYLALVAKDPRLPPKTRATAARLVTDTAESFWAGKRGLAAGEGSTKQRGRSIFSMHATQPAEATYPPGAVVELSTQLQAWMTLEAAAAVHSGTGADRAGS